MRGRWIVAALVAVLALAGCGSDEPAASDTVATEPAAAAPSEPAEDTADDTAEEESAPATDDAAGAATVEVASSDLGDILVDGEGMVLYLFDNDTDENSTCYDDCESNWPPLTGDVTAGEGVDESLLGTSEREDGTTQVTYAGHPLYYFAGDQAAGDTNGQAVGDVWWVVGADGESITDAAAAAGADSDSSGTGY